MTSSSDTFPFGIADVVELLGLTVRRRLPSSLYLNCPFCGDQRGRLNVNTDKNVWRCNRCGAAGGMLALYARHNCTGNADAYREICEALGRYTPRPRVNDCIGVKPGQNARAAPQEIHQTYSLLLSMLPLTPTHKAHLLSPRRGLTEEQIARFGFKSTPPAFLCRSYAERLRRHGCTLQGVPGFYQDDAGRWTINFGSRMAGILVPAVGMDGLICGMQIRLDTPLRRRDDPPGKSGAKYIWLSSVGKPHGVTSGSPLHFVGEPFAKTVYVTEGLLKADIAHCLTGRSFVAVAGVNSLNGLESALRCMAQNGTKLVVEAYDMDKLENEYVASAAEKVQQIARVAGLQSTSLEFVHHCNLAFLEFLFLTPGGAKPKQKNENNFPSLPIAVQKSFSLYTGQPPADKKCLRCTDQTVNGIAGTKYKNNNVCQCKLLCRTHTSLTPV